jgi:hypothetical protein
MKRKTLDFLFVISAITICIITIYLPPIHGVADQGDFERVMLPAGLDFINRSAHNFYGFIEQKYLMQFKYQHDALLYPLRLLAVIPATSYIYPITIAKFFCLFIGYFDTRVLAAIMCVSYIIICVFLLHRVRANKIFPDILLYALVLFIFFDGITLTMFNSMYGQSMMTVSMALFILSSVIVIQNIKSLCRAHLIFLFMGCVLLLSSKLQCIVFLPLMIIMWFYIIRRTGFYKITVVLLCLTVWHGAGGYIINSSALNEDTQYNSVFYGILKDSPDPRADLQSLGLSPELSADAGKHAYLDDDEYEYPPHSDALKTEFYNKMSNTKLIKFYILHPSRLINAMEKTANHAFYKKINLGTYSKDSGMPEGSSDYRCVLWGTLSQKLPKTLWFIAPMYLLFILGGLYEAIKHKNLYAYLFLIILTMGALQFPMPYLGNGNADITKQLYLFNEIFYLGIVVSVVYLVKRLLKIKKLLKI